MTHLATEIRQQAQATLPADTWGLVVIPWHPGEAYGVAANWRDPNAPIWRWVPGANEWTRDHPWTAGHYDGTPHRALVDLIEDMLVERGFGEDDASYLAADAANNSAAIWVVHE
ncbi:MAG: hypothetical protein ACTSWM_00690 [Alphaproteobacteria bacterium]